jgi:uncharacterized protein (TIGR02246 family)
MVQPAEGSQEALAARTGSEGSTTVSDQQVLDLVQRWADVELRGDADGYGDLLAPDFLGIGPVGFVLTADQWANRHRGDLHNDEFQVQDLHARIYGGDAAIVEAVLRQRTTAMGRDTSGSFRLVVVAVKQEGHWLLANIQLSGPLVPLGTPPPFARPVTQEES